MAVPEDRRGGHGAVECAAAGDGADDGRVRGLLLLVDKGVLEAPSDSSPARCQTGVAGIALRSRTRRRAR